MKKIIALMLAIVTTLPVFCTSVFAEELNKEESKIELEQSEEIDPRASLYFSSYSYDLEPSSKNGYLDFSTLVITTKDTDKVRVSIQIQQYNDGWEDYGGEYIGTSSKTSYSFEDTVKVERGKEYRALFYYEAFVDGKVVDERAGSTSSVLAP